METMMTWSPAPRPSVRRAGRAAVAGLALAVALSGGFALGRGTIANPRDEVRAPAFHDQGRIGSGSNAVGVPSHHPRVKWGGAGQSGSADSLGG